MSLHTMAERATGLAFSPHHPSSHFASGSVVLWSAGASGLAASLAELGGPAPRLSPLLFARLADPTALTALPSSGAVAVGDARGRLAVLGPQGAEAAAWQLSGSPVEAVCSLGGRLAAASGASLWLCDPSAFSVQQVRLGWSPCSAASTDAFTCVLAGRRLALYDSRTHRASALSVALPAAAVAVAAAGATQVVAGLVSGEVAAVELRQAAVRSVRRHAAGSTHVAVGAGGAAVSGGRDGVVGLDGEAVLGRLAAAVDSLACEPRLRAVAAASSGGRLVLAVQQ